MEGQKGLNEEAMSRWLGLGQAGIVVSVCYGPFGALRNPRWTVQAMGPDGSEFSRPFAASSAEHAIEIAETEAKRRGWIA